MTLKQVEPVECGDYRAESDHSWIVIRSLGEEVCLNEPEARALLEWLKRVCE